VEREACVTVNVGAKRPAPPAIPPVTPKVPTDWAPVLMSVLAGAGLAVVGMMIWPSEKE